MESHAQSSETKSNGVVRFSRGVGQHSALPPGPPFAPLQTLRYLRSPIELLRNCAREYGPVFTLRLLEGPMVVCGDIENTRRIFSAKPDTYGVVRADSIGLLIGPSSVAMLQGTKHRKERQLLTPALHGPSMKTYLHIMRDVTRRHLQALEPGSVFAAERFFLDIGLEIILRIVFGATTPEQIKTLGHLAHRYIDALQKAPIVLFIRALRREFGGRGPWANLQRAQQELDAFLYREIKARRASGSEAHDLLGLLLAARYDDGTAMEDSAIRDELLTVLMGARETTAIALTWMFYWLHRTPNTLETLHAELDRLGPDAPIEAMHSAPYLSAAVNETLRISPLASDIPRLLLQPLELTGWTLPPGTLVAPSPLLLHENETIYAGASRFDPNRFIQRNFSPFEFISFGGGNRRCIGAGLAQFQMKVVAASLLSAARFRLETSDPIRVGRLHVTIGPKQEIFFRVAAPRSQPQGG
jgi:cytochrome P450